MNWLKEEDSELWLVENKLQTISIGRSTYQDLIKKSGLWRIFETEQKRERERARESVWVRERETKRERRERERESETHTYTHTEIDQLFKHAK